MRIVTRMGHSRMLLLLVPLYAGVAFGQAPPTPIHPGQTRTYTVRFEGQYADKLTGAQLTFNLFHGDVPPNQAGFSGQLRFTDSKPMGDGVFEVSGMIPTTLASGVYKLVRVNAGTRDVGVSYQDGLPDIVITVDNPDRFVAPALKSVTEVSEKR